MKIAFRVHRAGGRQVADFQARHIKLFCEDGIDRRLNAAVIRTPLDRDGLGFQRVLYDRSNGEAIYWFRATFNRRKTKAEGLVLLTINPEVNEEGEGPPECSTGGQEPWKARRVPYVKKTAKAVAASRPTTMAARAAG
jgi:hypothetical protein